MMDRIACHYNYHDSIHKSDRKNLINNLEIAIENITNATGIPPKGFRAPNFDILPSDEWAYEEISKRFEYDSSFITNLPLKKICPNSKLSRKKLRIEGIFYFFTKFFN